jgi:predicted aldo/keto reductase-like oxidoreductase
MLDDMVKMGYYDVAVVMFNIAMAEDQRLLTAMEKAAQSGIGIIAMKTQCGDGGYMWWNRKNAPQNESKSDLNQTALLKWVLSHPFISTAIPGFTTFEQLEENFSVNLDQKLNEEEMSFLEKNKIQLAQSFCTHCGKCQGTCPNNTNIPDMMRTWMYAFQYRNMEQARLTAGSIQESCKGCETCSAICARGVQIGQRMEALKTAGLQYS